MKKEDLKCEVRSLLHNDYGDYGIERVASSRIYFPESIMPRGMSAEEREIRIWDVFCSDTPSGVGVSNYYGKTVDFMELTVAVAKKIYAIIKEQRRKENCL